MEEAVSKHYRTPATDIAGHTPSRLPCASSQLPLSPVTMIRAPQSQAHVFCGATPKPYVLPGPYPCPDDNDFFDSHGLPTLHPPLSPYHPSVSSCASTRLLLERLKHDYLSVVLLMRRVVPQERLVKPTLCCDSSCVHLIRQFTGRPNSLRS
jgi:hypothetical protein